MNLTALRAFVAVAETGSLTRAAGRLDLAQPSLSVALRRLEDQLGQKLLERRARRTDLTPFGHAFLPRARRMLAEFDQARAEARAVARGPRRLRLGLLPTLPNRPLGRLLADFAMAGTGLALELAEAPAEGLLARLQRGRLDAALTLLPADPFPSRPLFGEPYLLAMPARHRLASRPRIAIADLAGEPFVIRPDCEVLARAERAFAAGGLKPFVVARTAQEERLLDHVVTGLGLAFVPESLARRPDLALAAIAELPLRRRIGLAWRAGAAELSEPFLAFARSHDWLASAPMPDQRLAH
ncbi:MAG: LysR family transcriptional regulator [Alphaproteobacteria bacterium]|nr:LysR family transcriptional regulator [Alphaproteobacteria bacterium]